jgi:PhnB protein
MSQIALNPYFFFKGNCREAMEFYKSVFGGELTLMSYEDIPGMEIPEGLAGKLMHANLEGGDVHLMGSDTNGASDKSAKVSVSLTGTDQEHMTEVFNKLSEGGAVGHPLQLQPWGDMLGDLIDRFGIEWMVSITLSKQ